MIRLIVGLGNPGKDYQGTRHNIGFECVERFARQEIGSLIRWRGGFRGEYVEFLKGGKKVTLLKPLTFMNLSGESVAEAVSYYKLQLNELLVVHDELDLPLGVVKLKNGGGDAGHNGIKSIVAALGSRDFFRLRFGLGRPLNEEPAKNWVLKMFTKGELSSLALGLQKACRALDVVLVDGVIKAQNIVNAYE
ncbi:MAG TPA: aminoacyl-tRNA hydrolase [Oligoflexia bacterium]|nr:aminoacyl-tRNA hydrolase [Oligoflexia bacterium]HMP26742.1 aminoacyl-tRNA hydrolase [Oligoflexia bacterium]